MPLQIKKTSSVWSGPATPFFKKTTGGYVSPNKVFLKTGSSTWTEVWPLLPGVPTSPSMNWVYRNDRIEVDMTWGAAPGSGTNATPVANANYVLYLIINGAIYAGYNLGTATSLTLTNNGSGFQNYAGQPVYFAVQAQSAAGVYGAQVFSGTTTIPQLPAPPQVTSVAQALTFGDLSYSWAHVGGNRLSGFQVNINSSYGPATYFFGAATSSSTGAHPWSGGSVNGGTYQVDIYPYGPGGYGPVYTFTGAIPDDVQFSNTRFTNQNLTANAQNVGFASSFQLYWNLEGGPNNYYSNFAGFTSLSLTRASIGVGDYNRARYLFVPLNAFGSGRVTATPFVRVIPNSYHVDADDGDTWLNGGFLFGGLVEQGFDGGVNADYYGYMFYGNKFRDQLNDAYLGYHINITAASILMGRTTFGAAGPVVAVLGLQTAGDRGGATNVFSGLSYCYPSENEGDWVFVNFDPNWVRYMIDQTNGWKGFGMFISDPSQSQNGRWFNNGTIYPTLGWPALRVLFNHDG